MTDKELIKFVKKKIKNREAKFLSHEKSIQLHKSIYWICLVLVIFSFLTIPLIWMSDAPKYLIGTVIIFIIAGIAVMLHSKILISEPPSKEIEKDKWIWIQGRRLYFLKNLSIVFSIILVGVFLILDYETFSKTDYFQYLPFILLAMCFELMANLIVVLIYKNPKLIINGVVTGIGSAFKIIGVISGTLLLFGLILKNGNILYLFIVFLLLPHFVRYLKWIFGPYRKKELNTIQESVIKFVNPGKFLVVLRTELKILKDKSEAIDILKKLKQKNKYGVELALLEELTILYTNKRYWLVTLLIAISIFVLGAIAEGFFQDIIYEPLKKIFEKK